MNNLNPAQNMRFAIPFQNNSGYHTLTAQQYLPAKPLGAD